MRLTALSLCAVVALAGCASKPAPEPYPARACLEAIPSQPELQPLGGRLEFTKPADLARVSDTARPTAEQRPAIQAAEARYVACIELGAPWRRAHVAPESEAVGMRFVRTVQADLAVLYRGEITFGEYNSHYNALRADLEQRLNEINAARAQRQDEFQRQATIARIMAPPPPALPPPVQFPAYQVVRPPVMPSPTTTTCNVFGNQVVCNTQ